jgi:hypothetical protein
MKKNEMGETCSMGYNRSEELYLKPLERRSHQKDTGVGGRIIS